MISPGSQAEQLKVVQVRNAVTGSKDELVHGLNQDMAAEWGRVLANLRLITSGQPEVTETLRAALTERVKREIEHVRVLTAAVLELGGEPAQLPRDYPHHNDLSQTLRLNADIERELAERYDRRATLADIFDQPCLAERLRRMAAAKRESADSYHAELVV